MSEWAIEIENLHFSYGRNEILRGVNMKVPVGSIFGFLGRNGAGKTTTIKTLLGLLTPSAGSCRVLGIYPAVDPLAVRSKIGYMAEDQQMYGWMKVQEIIRWVGSFYPSWDDKLIAGLLDLLELPREGKVKTLSKGQNSRLALLLSLGHHPRLVILDDPTLGLDPIARKEFLRYVIGLLQRDGVTVFFSSHLLYEIEPVADRVAILDHGQIVKSASTDELRESVRRFIIPKSDFNADHLTGLLDLTRDSDSASLTVENCDEKKRAQIVQLAGQPIHEQGLNLDEIFEAYVIGNRGVEKKIHFHNGHVYGEEQAHA
ncbi:MAG: ABC transporter ATP-binding protein [Phycisphaerae bacterium]